MTDLLVIAIDGPAGAGKSTIARALAKRLGLNYLDTGAMYRAVTWAAMQKNISLIDVEALGSLAVCLDLDVGDEFVIVDGIDITNDIRSAPVTAGVSTVAANSIVRQELRKRQRVWCAQRQGGVVEGRDIGTVVFPEAVLKVYLTASPHVRAQRRVAQDGGDLQEIEKSIADRDFKDSRREDSPLVESLDSVVVDTSDRSVGEVVDLIANLVAERML